MRKELKFKAVHDSDLDDLLEALGILDLLESGKLRCGICQKKVTRENFYCVYSDRRKVKICCNEIQCYDKLIRRH